MPKDNHSLMQLYLDGFKIFIHFLRNETSSVYIDSTSCKLHSFLKNKNLNDVKQSQYYATQSVFKKKYTQNFLIKKSEET